MRMSLCRTWAIVHVFTVQVKVRFSERLVLLGITDIVTAVRRPFCRRLRSTLGPTRPATRNALERCRNQHRKFQGSDTAVLQSHQEPNQHTNKNIVSAPHVYLACVGTIRLFRGTVPPPAVSLLDSIKSGMDGQVARDQRHGAGDQWSTNTK